jgi:hypothetical protein
MTEAESSEQSNRDTAVSNGRRVVDHILLWGAGTTAVIFLSGLVVSFVGLCFVRHPNLGWSDQVVNDAKGVATGHFQYGNPAKQFVGFVYTPLYTWAFAGLLKIFWWEGWGPVLSMVAVAVAIVALVRMLWATTPEWEGRVATSAVVVAVTLGGLSAFAPHNGLYETRPDQMAWCLCVIAATIVFQGLLAPAGLSRRQLLLVGGLLTASVFTKQTTVVTCVVLALLTIAVPILRDPIRSWTWRKGLRSATALLTFVGCSLVFGIALQVASRGYAYDLLVRDPLRYGLVQPIRTQIGVSLRFLAVPLAAMAVLVVCAAVSLVANRHHHQRRRIFVALAAVVVAASPIPSAIIAKAKLGGDVNQLAGPVWTLTIGCAVLLLLLRPSSRQLAASAIACGVLLVAIAPLSHVFAGHQLSASRLYPPQTWGPIDPFLQSAVDNGDAVYDSTLPSLSVSENAPGYPAGNWIDQFAAGYVPRYFLANLVDGRYALVRPIPDTTENLPYYSTDNEHYYSDLGRYDGSIPWKINQLLSMGYTPATDPYSTVVYYRPSPKLAQLGWFAGCFGPYRAADAGVDVRVRGSGGLVCIDNGDLHMTKAPGPTTELVMKLREGNGQAVARFKKAPQTLNVYRLDSRDSVSPATPAPSCVNNYGSETTVTIKAVEGNGGVVCRQSAGGSVLEVPVAGGSTAHVSLVVAATDSPTVVAQSTGGKSVPFKTVNPKP